MHVFLLMVWGGFFLMWPRSTLLATVTIPVIVVLGLLWAHDPPWAASTASTEVPLPPGYVLDAPGESTGKPWLKYQDPSKPWLSDPIVTPHWQSAPLATPSDK